MTETQTVNLPLSIMVRSDERTVRAYSPEGWPHVAPVVYGSSVATAKKAMRESILANLPQTLADAKYAGKIGAIGCTDGTVMVVSFSHGQWGYRFAGPDRSGRLSSGCMGMETYEEAVQRASDHADSFDGVAWRNV